MQPFRLSPKDEAMEPLATSPATDTGDSSTSLTDTFSVHDGAVLQDLAANEPKSLAPGCVVRIGANKRNTTGKVAAFIGTLPAMPKIRLVGAQKGLPIICIAKGSHLVQS